MRELPSEDSPRESNLLTREDLLTCLETLQRLVESNREGLELFEQHERIAFLKAAGMLSRPCKDDIVQRKKDARKKSKEERRALDKRARERTGIRVARTAEVFEAPRQKLLEGSPKVETVPKSLESSKGDSHDDYYLPNNREDAIPSEEQPKSEDTRPSLSSYRNCYVCKAKFTELHHFYDSMCQRCGNFNYQKRFQTADLSGQVALVTGSRLKIGYHVCLMLLRAGATVIATTRFPVDSALRYSREEDFPQWQDRLHVHGLDLRHTPSVELFCDYVEYTYKRLDILINNAAQTVRRPAGFYAHLLENEQKPTEQTQEVQRLLSRHAKCLRAITSGGSFNTSPDQDETIASSLITNERPNHIGLSASAQLSQTPYEFSGHGEQNNTQIFPKGKLDVDLQQVDLRTTNSWRLRLGEVSTVEMMEVQLVNAVAPFVLCNRLAPLMKQEPHTGKKHIVNVTAMEGKFYRFSKNPRHPHTNMAKAALNMLTHTGADELSRHGVFMNAVDTGWVTDEDPAQLADRRVKVHDFQPPLDIVDGAARVCDPIFDGINRGEHWVGKFLKDFMPIDW